MNKINKFSGIKKLNIFFGIFFIAVLTGYIFIANYAVSQQYELGALSLRLNRMRSISVKSNDDDNNTIGELRSFAQQNGMIEAREVYSMFQDTGVAVSQLR